MAVVSVPPFLQDVLGTSQHAAVLVLIVSFGVCVPVALIIACPALFTGLPLWRSGLAVLLILDIAAGCIANFTPATSSFYATRPLSRWIFIAIHGHIVAVALLLGTDIISAIAVWAFAVVGAGFVNALIGSRLQPMAGALVLATGLVGTGLLVPASPVMLAVMQLFLLKLVYAFAVDHFGDAAKDVR